MVVSGAGRRTRRLTLVAATLAAVTSGTAGTTEARPVTGDPGGTIQPISATTIADVEPRSPTPGFLLERGRYITLEVPGATVETGAGGINNRGEIVGGARGGGMPDRGFLRDARGRYSTFRFPGSRSTLAQKINDRGQITGYFSNTADDPREDPTGFLLASGRYTRIAFPGAVTTTAVGINNRTQIVGQYQDADGRFHGYMWHRGRFATIDAPGALDTSLTDINDRGQVIGICLDRDGTVSAFLLHRGRFTSFSSPGAEFTAPGDINNRGQIVGFSIDGALDDPSRATVRSFLLPRGVGGPFSRIRFPGALTTLAFGLNDRGQITGAYNNPQFGELVHPSAE